MAKWAKSYRRAYGLEYGNSASCLIEMLRHGVTNEKSTEMALAKPRIIKPPGGMSERPAWRPVAGA